jgi:pSer/pThr/pTyr-binding forkhead associated (FHA) protein
MTAPYIKLIMLSKDSNEHKGVHFFSFSKKQSAFIGRSSTAGIRVIDDISISRNHAELNYLEGRLFLSDYKSKFGTLKLIK